MGAKELEELEPPKPQLTVPLASGDAAAIKKLSNNGAEEKLGMKVQPDGCNKRHLSALKDKVESWTPKVDGSQLPARAVCQIYTQQLWSSMKYGLGACLAALEELENGLGAIDYYLTSQLGVMRNIPKQPRYLPHQYCGMELLNLPMEHGDDSRMSQLPAAALRHEQRTWTHDDGRHGAPAAGNRGGGMPA